MASVSDYLDLMVFFALSPIMGGCLPGYGTLGATSISRSLLPITTFMCLPRILYQDASSGLNSSQTGLKHKGDLLAHITRKSRNSTALMWSLIHWLKRKNVRTQFFSLFIFQPCFLRASFIFNFLEIFFWSQDDCQKFSELQVSLFTSSRKKSINPWYTWMIKRFSYIKAIEESLFFFFLLPPSDIPEPIILNKGIGHTHRFNLMGTYPHQLGVELSHQIFKT